jgi:hypothetical protein
MSSGRDAEGADVPDHLSHGIGGRFTIIGEIVAAARWAFIAAGVAGGRGIRFVL